MPYTLTSTQIPAIQQPAAFKSIADSYGLGASATMLNAYKLPDTVPTNLSGPFNGNAVRMDLLGRYGGANAYAVAWGLDISAGAGLTLNIARGHAIIDGVTEVNTASTLVVPGNTARVWIWLAQNGSLAYTTITTPPAGAQCLLGSCVTGAGAIVSVDQSGVLYRDGGILWRRTADNGMPIDSPPSNIVFLHQTNFNAYYWTGTQYTPQGVPQVATDPATPAAGDIWFRTDTAQLSLLVGGSSIRRFGAVPVTDNPPFGSRLRRGELPIPYRYWMYGTAGDPVNYPPYVGRFGPADAGSFIGP